ncbi:MAG: hypothetical protein AMXMBFR81_31350 [Chthonomonas sp.]|nr:hypothetical protein [Fimbriimonadaceae bacterium]
MKNRVHRERRSQKSTVFVALMLFQFVLVLLQLWLFVSVLEGQIGGGAKEMAVPGAAVSVAILAVNIWMLLGIRRMDASE